MSRRGIGPVRRFFKQRVTIQVRTDATDPMGDDEPLWSDVPGWIGLRASIQPATSKRIEEAARRGSVVAGVIYLMGALEVGIRHRILCGERILTVVGPSRDVGGQSRLTEIDVEEVCE